ncbi:response regulator [Sedimentimonas flavescens]|uniref:Response regulator n=1 Tax=Sedimentimonas flavescens TaxID=2851012 RepID=A0ABT2ZUV0_9RHOB|nr:response regulator [Sedimentimonas flavescens]MCV2877525.1 response regulator [Sedimentimonas flavescens]
MSDDLSSFLAKRSASAERPLAGLTVLVVEDSRFACEALRLMCLRSGARIRRADCLCAARRHLQTYRPNVVIVDLGLPDGSGDELIAQIKATSAPAVFGISGDAGSAALAMAAGADGFLEKPIESLALFQSTILAGLPDHARHAGPRRIEEAPLIPDPLALQDDLSQMAAALREPPEAARLGYVAQFLTGVARAAHDAALADAASALERAPSPAAVARLSSVVNARLSERAAF